MNMNSPLNQAKAMAQEIIELKQAYMNSSNPQQQEWLHRRAELLRDEIATLGYEDMLANLGADKSPGESAAWYASFTEGDGQKWSKSIGYTKPVIESGAQAVEESIRQAKVIAAQAGGSSKGLGWILIFAGGVTVLALMGRVLRRGGE